MKMIALLFCVALYCSMAAVMEVEAGNNKHLSLLMVGNSFSDAHNMEEMIQTMLHERKVLLNVDSVFAARFDQHAANLTKIAESPELPKMIDERPWTWVVLQEQSEIPGFYPPMETPGMDKWYTNSLQSILQLNQQIQAKGATTVLFQTWGYFEKDPINPTLYPDYQTMQDRISKGYQMYQDSILKDNPAAKVKVAPGGMAFETIFNSVLPGEGSPLDKGSLFDQLYNREEDPRKHPTLAGSYLCACVLFQTLTGLDARQTSYKPAEMPLTLANTLRTVAYNTVVAFEGGNSSPSYKPSSSRTPPPYHASSATGNSGSFWRWIMTFFVVGGGVVGWVGWKRGHVVSSRNRGSSQFAYEWDPLPNTTTVSMELTDVPGSGYTQPKL